MRRAVDFLHNGWESCQVSFCLVYGRVCSGDPWACVCAAQGDSYRKITEGRISYAVTLQS